MMEQELFDQRDMTILIVDDEVRIRDFVRMNLELEHYRVIEAGDGIQALDQLRENLPDLIVLDVMMPEMDGFEALRAIREVSTIPVIMLTVRQGEQDKIHGLDLGADDYLAKPFSPRELLSRIRALLRRSLMAPPSRKTEIIVDPDLRIDFARREVVVRGKKVVLRPTEYRLLYHLVSNAGRLLTHETLLSKVWGREYRDEAHYLRLYITYLRQKLEKDPAHPQYILTERGVGYRFKALDDND
jgi:DNA-binding response OmpR family regulator